VEVASRIRAAVIGVPVSIPPALSERFPELARVRYRRGGLPPRIGGWALGVPSVAAITLWKTVFLAPNVGFPAELLLHELAHVQQFQDVRGFAIRYLWESIRTGYQENRYEVAARRFAAHRLRAAGPSSPASLPAQEV
jgi:hypothetical protein